MLEVGAEALLVVELEPELEPLVDEGDEPLVEEAIWVTVSKSFLDVGRHIRLTVVRIVLPRLLVVVMTVPPAIFVPFVPLDVLLLLLPEVVELLLDIRPPLVEFVLPPITLPVEPAPIVEVVVEPMLSVVVITPVTALAAVRTVAVVAPVSSVWTTVAVVEPLLAAAIASKGKCQSGFGAKIRSCLRSQNASPAAMIELVSVTPVEGHNPAEQSRTPLPKSIFVHRQVMLFAGQPNDVALPNMLLMHVFYVDSQYASSILVIRVKGSLTPQAGRALMALRS